MRPCNDRDKLVYWLKKNYKQMLSHNPAVMCPPCFILRQRQRKKTSFIFWESKTPLPP